MRTQSNHHPPLMMVFSFLKNSEPPLGLEPRTFALQKRCSPPERTVRYGRVPLSHPADLNREPSLYKSVALPIELGWQDPPFYSNTKPTEFRRFGRNPDFTSGLRRLISSKYRRGRVRPLPAYPPRPCHGRNQLSARSVSRPESRPLVTR